MGALETQVLCSLQPTQPSSLGDTLPLQGAQLVPRSNSDSTLGSGPGLGTPVTLGLSSESDDHVYTGLLGR